MVLRLSTASENPRRGDLPVAPTYVRERNFHRRHEEHKGRESIHKTGNELRIVQKNWAKIQYFVLRRDPTPRAPAAWIHVTCWVSNSLAREKKTAKKLARDMHS